MTDVPDGSRTDRTDRITVEGRVHQNPYLAAGEREMYAVVGLTVTAPRSAPAGAAEVIVLDASGSMDRDGKRERAVEAGIAAVEAVRDGARFAVVAGSHEARTLWPATPGLRVADAASRADAARAVRGLPASGGTAMGTWLRLCRELLADRPEDLRHVTLLTDGHNEHESAAELDAVVRACVGHLRCDCRGIGVDFDPAELYNITEKLDGTMHAVVDPAGLADDFTGVMTASMAKHVELDLLLWTPAAATARVQQLTPAIADLPAAGADTAAGTGRHLLGTFGDETREYLLRIEVDPPSGPSPRLPRPRDGGPAVLAEKLVGRVSVALRHPGPDAPVLRQSFRDGRPDGPDGPDGRGQVLALWTDDPVAPLTPDERVAAARGGLELARELRAGIVAWRDGRVADANSILRGVRTRAAESGDRQLADRMDRIYDEVSDTFHLDVRDEIELFEESTVTTLLNP